MTTAIDDFKSSIVVLDTETTNLDPKQCEIVEIAGTTWIGSWNTKSLLLGAKNGIPAEASAKNNISNNMIANKLTFKENIHAIKTILHWNTNRYFVCHNAAYDRMALATSFNTDSDIDICNDDTKWICTWRLSKHILNHDFGDIQYGLNYLRYKLDLPVSDDIGVHRAGADTIVCGMLLDKLIEIAIEHNIITANEPIGPQLNELCWRHIPVKYWQFGKHKGKLLTELDNDYYKWAINNLPQFNDKNSAYDADLVQSVVDVLNTRLSNA